MKPRHAASLALVGWYLMVAPSTGLYWGDGMVRNTSAPLAGWEVRGSYDSLADCRQEAITLFSPPATVHKGRFYVMKNEFLYSYGVRLGYVCVSSADSRLKEK